MQTLVYADLSNRKLSSTLGGTALTFPQFVQGDKVRIGMRFSESQEGAAMEVVKNVANIRASIGYVDARPASGLFVLRTGAAPYVAGTNETAAIAFDAAAGIVQAALAAIIPGGGVAVTRIDGSWIITNDGNRIELSGAPCARIANELKPLSFVRVRESQFSGGYRYDVRLVQAPLASTSSFDTIVPPAPSITRVQEGGSSESTIWPEIQALKILSTFRGTYQIRRGYKKTAELSVDDGPEEIQAALSELADDEGNFTVSNPAANIAHITFNGSMAGLPQDLLQVAVFSAPPGDPTIVLDLNTYEIAAALRAADEIKPVLEIEVTVRDENDPDVTYVLTPFRAPVTVVRELNWEGLETAATIDWLHPPYGRTYVPFTEDQIITGSQHYVTPVGDGANTAFVISHNLGTRAVHVTVRRNGGDLAIVQPQKVALDGEDSLTVFFVTAPAENEFVVTISTAGPVSAFQTHTHTIAQVEDLQIILDDLGGRVETLENIVALPGASGRNVQATVIEMVIPETDLIIPAPQGAVTARPLLLGAIHDTTADAAIPPIASAAAIANNVVSINTAWTIPAALNRRKWPVKSGGYIASNGSVLYEVRKSGNSYFPVEYEHDIFMLWIAAEMFPAKRIFTLDCAPVLQLLGNTRAQYMLEVAYGTTTQDTGTGYAANLASVTWDAPVIAQRIILSNTIVTHPVSLKIESDETAALTATASIYGRTQTVTPPSSSAFAVRARLLNFETENRESARGQIILTMPETTATITSK